MVQRLKIWVLLAGIGISQLFFNIGIAGPWWVLTKRGSPPNPDETLSSRVGRAAIAGKRWGLWAEKEIDLIFADPGHCRRAAERRE